MEKVMSSIHVRVPKIDKELAIAKLSNSGMDLSTAINIFIKQLIRQEKFPVEIFTEYRFPESVYRRLDEATEGRQTAEYVTIDDCCANWDLAISEVENGKV